MFHCTLILRICGCPLSLPPFLEQVGSVLPHKPLKDGGEEGGMCVLISRERGSAGVGGSPADSGDVSPQMEQAGR